MPRPAAGGRRLRAPLSGGDRERAHPLASVKYLLRAVRRFLHVAPAKRRRFRPAQATLEQQPGKRPCSRRRRVVGRPGGAGRRTSAPPAPRSPPRRRRYAQGPILGDSPTVTNGNRAPGQVLLSVAPRSAASASDSMPRPVRLGMLAVAMIAATSSAVSGSAWPRPAAWRVRPCSTRRTPSWPVGSSARRCRRGRRGSRRGWCARCGSGGAIGNPPIDTARECWRRGYRGVPDRRAPGRLRSIRPAGW